MIDEIKQNNQFGTSTSHYFQKANG